MKTLVLDDNPWRHKYFDDRLDGEIVHVYSYSDAIGALNTQNFDAIYLDHDLGDFHNPDKHAGKELTGYDVCRWMVDNDIDCPNIVVHSANPVGARAMVDFLRDYYPCVNWQMAAV